MPKRGDIYSVLSWKKIKETETSRSEYLKTYLPPDYEKEKKRKSAKEKKRKSEKEKK